jgi:protein CpxP
MKVTFQRAAAAGVLVLTLAGAAAASAQDRQPGPARDGQRAAERQKMFEEFKQRREQRLHDILQIKPAQEGAFKTFVSSVGPKPRGDKDGHPGEGRPGAERKEMTTTERLDRMAQRLAEAQGRIQATRAFYASLTPEQRKAFDEVGPGMGRSMMAERVHFRGPPGGPHGLEGPPPPPR